MKNRMIMNLIIGSFLISIALMGYFVPGERMPAWTGTKAVVLDFCDHEVGRYVTVVDEEGRVITKTSRQVFPGDEIITSEAEHYRVTRVDRDVAQARLLGEDRELQAWSEYFAQNEKELAVPVQGFRETDVAIYHSHTMESYVPTAGTAFQDHGEIIEVGRLLADQLRQRGLNVIHDATNHNPHDAQAYERSRRTAAQLLERNPRALIDVHRDGVPDPEFYRREIGQQTVTQIRLVIGRQNPKQDANTDFARRLMARANEQHPNLVKEIFMASGNYNQDLLSNSILIEAGTHTNSKNEAQQGIVLLADAVPAVLGLGPAGPDQAGGIMGWRVALGIAAAVLIGLGAYLVISAGGVPQAREKLSQFLNREFSGGTRNRPDNQDKLGE